jgi:hypothetical protein
MTGVTRERGKPVVAILTADGKYAVLPGPNKAMRERLWAREEMGRAANSEGGSRGRG